MTVPRKARAGAYRVRVTLTDVADILGSARGGESRWCQVVAPGASDPAIAARTQAWAAEQAGDGAGSLDAWRGVTASSTATLDDWYRLARAARRVNAHETDVAATAHIRAHCAKDDRPLALAAEGDALRRAGKAAEAVTLLRSELLRMQAAERKRWDDDGVEGGERISVIPVALLAAYGRVAVAAGDLDAAEAANAALLYTLDLTGSPEVPIFRRELREARVRRDVRDRPEDPSAWAGYGRWLLDEGRATDAEAALAKAVALKTTNPSVATDLATARQAMGGPRAPEPPLAVLVESAARAAGEGRGLAPSRDCAVWQRYGLLLLRQAARRRGAGDAEAAATQAHARRVLEQAVVMGRAGAEFEGVQMSTTNAFAGETRYVAGYASPGIERAAALLAAFRRLDAAPDDYHAWRAASDALLTEEEPETAAETVAQCVRLAPARAETLALRARLAELRDEPGEAVRLWTETLAKNPHDPEARPRLAALAAAGGDFAAATGYLLAHRVEYGSGGGR
jgi:tetratricopeptide (TPR) repeat protein